MVLQADGGHEEISLSIAGVTVDLRRRGLYRGSERVRLSPKAFEVLVLLVRNRGRVVRKDEVLQAVWGERRSVNTVEQAVRQVRPALWDRWPRQPIIPTHPPPGGHLVG